MKTPEQAAALWSDDQTIQDRRDILCDQILSGEYEIGKSGTLRDRDNRFCAFGIACDITDPSKWKIKESAISCWAYPEGNGLLRTTVVPYIVRDFFGFTNVIDITQVSDDPNASPNDIVNAIIESEIMSTTDQPD